MTRLDRIRPYVEKLLREGFGIPDLQADDDGDYPLRFHSAGYYVRLYNEQAPTIQVFSVVVRDIKRSSKLLQALNDINAVTSYARLYWVNNQVVIATELVAETLDGEELGNACNIIGKVADRVGAELSAQFGGHVLFEDNEDTPKVSVVPTGHAGYI